MRAQWVCFTFQVSWLFLFTIAVLLPDSSAADQLLISPGSGERNDIRNGGFESIDNGRTYFSRWGRVGSYDDDFEGWHNYRWSQNRPGRNQLHQPPEGKYRGLVNSVATGSEAGNGCEPAINTGYIIQPGDRFVLSFRYAGALGWTSSSGLRIIATLYFDDDGIDHDGRDQVIDRITVTPTTNANEGQPYSATGELNFSVTSASLGKVARLRFQTNRDENIFAAIDDVTLRVVSATHVTYQSGDLPIILSAPHGGRRSIPGVSPRQGTNVPRFKSQSDLNTDKLAEQFAVALEQKLGRRPYVVIARFHRRYVDANRPVALALESDQASATYQAYHDSLARARQEVVQRWGRGLLLDLHGQKAEPQAIFRGTQNGKTTTHLINRFNQQALTGQTSLMGRLAEQGFEVIPSVDSSAAETNNYSGGYIVRTYGSQDGGTLDAIQLELGRELRQTKQLANTAERLAKATTAFARDYLPTSDLVQVGVYVDKGVGRSVRKLLLALSTRKDICVSKLTADDILTGRHDELDLIIHPGGSGGGQGRHLGEEGRETIRKYVADGGGFIGVCAGAYLASAHYSWSLHILDAKVLDTKHWNRGTGTVEIDITAAGRQWLNASSGQLSIFYGQGPLLARGDRTDIADYQELATFQTEIAKNGAPTGVMPGTTAIAAGRYGQGQVICFSPHPELTAGLEPLLLRAVDQVKRRKSASQN